MNDKSMVSVSKQNRDAAGVAAGDQVTIEVELDTEPRKVDLPDDMAAALDAEPAARATFDALSNSDKKWHVAQATGAKTAETRTRRISRSVAALAQG